MKIFGLIGVGGYVAKRHLRAIKETNNNLLIALNGGDNWIALTSEDDVVSVIKVATDGKIRISSPPI